MADKSTNFVCDDEVDGLEILALINHSLVHVIIDIAKHFRVRPRKELEQAKDSSDSSVNHHNELTIAASRQDW